MKMDNNQFIERNIYLKKIESFIDKPVIKVLTGMRRSGKSSLLKLIVKKLKEEKKDTNIIYINKESLEFDFIKDYISLYEYVKSKIKKDFSNYIFIDEIQEISGWEKAINSFLADNVADTFISGSNAHLLSGELATLISGRYIEIPVFPLTFKEFIEFRKRKKDTKNKIKTNSTNTDEIISLKIKIGKIEVDKIETIDIENEFKNYLRYGGLPGIHFFDFNEEVIYDYLNSILNTIILKDVVVRNKIKDVSNLEKIILYLFNNTGNITSAKNISNFFESQKIKISVDTILSYIKFLENSFLIRIIKRYDIKWKKTLEYLDKIFFTDIGLRNGLIGYKDNDINGILENLVHNELLARGYKLYIGKLNDLEIDFIAENKGQKSYFQVCYSLANRQIEQREFGNLLKIKDNYEKIVISLDKYYPSEKDGVKHKYLIDFLLEK